MRIQLNKNGIELPSQPSFLNIKTRRSWSDIIHDEKSASKKTLAWVCPHCGVELFIQTYSLHVTPIIKMCLGYDLFEKKLLGGYTRDDEYNNSLREKISLFVDEYYKPMFDEEKEILKGADTWRASSSFPCPICSNDIIMKTPGYSFIRDEVSLCKAMDIPINEKSKAANPDLIFIYLKNQRHSIDIPSITDEISSMKENWEEEPYETQFSNERISTIKTSPEELKSFLKQLINLEMGIYTLTEWLSQLFFQRNEAKLLSYQRECLIKKKYADSVAEAENNIALCKKAISDVDTVTPAELSVTYPVKPTMPKEPELKKAGLFNKKQTNIENDRLLKEYSSQKAKYDEDLHVYELEYSQKQEEFEKKRSELRIEREKQLKEAEQFKEQIKTEADTKAAKEISESSAEQMLYEKILSEIAESTSLLKKYIQTKNAYYQSGIVFSKYQNVVALSTFCEYLMAGRCESLEGANGAYNIYETEIRADLIISQLSTIITSLEQIKENQFLLYSELKQANKTLNNLSTKIDKVSQTLSDMKDSMEMIEYNTAATAYYSKKNMELTDAMGLMVALK